MIAFILGALRPNLDLRNWVLKKAEPPHSIYDRQNRKISNKKAIRATNGFYFI
jgi:hypothetical protein